ncbi:hypothetical protein ACFXCR_34730, partial [Streptomyces sp. NPDC059431]
MRVLPPMARAYIVCAVLAAAGCAAPALADSGTPWPSVALLALLYLGCELVKVCPFLGHRVPEGLGSFFPVVLAAVFLLPPAAAALVAIPGGLAGTVMQRPAWVRRTWHAAQQAIAAWIAGWTYGLLGGVEALAGGSGGAPRPPRGGRPPPRGAAVPDGMRPAAPPARALRLVGTPRPR